MYNYLLIKKTEELEKLSKQLGFTKTFFLEDFNIIKSSTKKGILKEIKQNKINLLIASTEELLRFALEKTSVDIVMGMEKIHPKDSVHFVRGGLDQVLCKIARDKKKIFSFSFSDILNSSSRGKLMGRVMFNLKLCKKYNVNVIFSNFSSIKEEMRARKDLEVFLQILKK